MTKQEYYELLRIRQPDIYAFIMEMTEMDYTLKIEKVFKNG